VRGCHTQGRTVDEGRRRIRKAMELFVDEARSAKLVDNVKLPATASKRLWYPPPALTSLTLASHQARSRPATSLIADAP
jgi:hypothetical protein